MLSSTRRTHFLIRNTKTRYLVCKERWFGLVTCENVLISSSVKSHQNRIKKTKLSEQLNGCIFTCVIARQHSIWIDVWNICWNETKRNKKEEINIYMHLLLVLVDYMFYICLTVRSLFELIKWISDFISLCIWGTFSCCFVYFVSFSGLWINYAVSNFIFII